MGCLLFFTLKIATLLQLNPSPFKMQQNCILKFKHVIPQFNAGLYRRWCGFGTDRWLVI